MGVDSAENGEHGEGRLMQTACFATQDNFRAAVHAHCDLLPPTGKNLRVYQHPAHPRFLYH